VIPTKKATELSKGQHDRYRCIAPDHPGFGLAGTGRTRSSPLINRASSSWRPAAAAGLAAYASFTT